MKFWLRWTANGLTVFLALYLVDSVAGGRFQISAVWVAVILAVLLGLLNSLVRPLRRARSKPLLALARTLLTVLMNLIILQVFVWSGSLVIAESFLWVLGVAVFVSVLTSTISWLVGFSSKEKRRVTSPRQIDAGASREGEARTSRTRT